VFLARKICNFYFKSDSNGFYLAIMGLRDRKKINYAWNNLSDEKKTLLLLISCSYFANIH
jgi:hypothetical protein